MNLLQKVRRSDGTTEYHDVQNRISDSNGTVISSTEIYCPIPPPGHWIRKGAVGRTHAYKIFAKFQKDSFKSHAYYEIICGKCQSGPLLVSNMYNSSYM